MEASGQGLPSPWSEDVTPTPSHPAGPHPHSAPDLREFHSSLHVSCFLISGSVGQRASDLTFTQHLPQDTLARAPPPHTHTYTIHTYYTPHTHPLGSIVLVLEAGPPPLSLASQCPPPRSGSSLPMGAVQWGALPPASLLGEALGRAGPMGGWGEPLWAGMPSWPSMDPRSDL